MATLLTEVNSVLGIEIGSVHTRAVLFDVVEESYKFIAAGTAFTSLEEPFNNVQLGVIEAITNLQEITGRFFLDLNKNLIIPSHGSVEGVDKLLVTISCGSDLRAVTFGLLNEISLDTANRLARTAPLQLVDSFGVNDRRTFATQMDALIADQPDIMIFAGGSDGGATKSVARMAKMIAATLRLIPSEERPKVLFCGNLAATRKVKEILEDMTSVEATSNIRPEIDTEDLSQASIDLSQLIINKKIELIAGLDRITSISSDQPLLAGIGLLRVIRFLGKQYDPQRGVLGLDLGSAHVIASYANHQKSNLVELPIGTGMGLENALKLARITEIEKWIDESLPDDYLLNYLWQKTLFPKSIPLTEVDLTIELALVRYLLSVIMRELDFRGDLTSRSFEPILVSGSTLTHAATSWQVLMTLLDGIQPVGITPLVVDKHGLLSLLGAAAKANPLLPVQVLESSAFINLATVVTLESSVKPGTLLLDATLQTSSGYRREISIRQGTLSSLPLPFGEPGLLTIKPVKKFRIADNEVTSEPIKVRGGVCGLVFDARGRPIILPGDHDRRRELLKSWKNPPKDQ